MQTASMNDIYSALYSEEQEYVYPSLQKVEIEDSHGRLQSIAFPRRDEKHQYQHKSKH